MKARIRAKVEHPFPGDQAAVRGHKGALSRLGEEHGPDPHAVRSVEPVDGVAKVDGDQGMNASLKPETRLQAAAAAAPRSKSLPTLIDRAIWSRQHRFVYSAMSAERVLQNIP